MVFKSITNLPRATRLTVGLCLFAWGSLGLYLTPFTERALGIKAATEQDYVDIKAKMPSIRITDRVAKGSEK